MKVLAVTPLYPPFSRVGAWLATHRYLAHLVERGHRVDVVPYLSGHAPYPLDGVHVHTQGTEIDADVTIVHSGNHPDPPPGPLVVIAHNPDADIPPHDLLVANSEATAAALGLPSIVCRPVTSVAEHTTTPGDRVTMVNLSENKGGELFRLLISSMPSTPFLAVRGGYGRQLVPRLSNAETIHSTTDMRTDVWSRTRVLLCPSKAESWCMTAVEAMCSGIPVIAHPSSGLLESLGPAGIFVDRSDLAGWRREIARLDDPDEWDAASELARNRATDLDTTADLDRFARAIEELI